MNDVLWREVINEARDRLSQGIAEDVDDAVEQLVEESICTEDQAPDLKAALENPR